MDDSNLYSFIGIGCYVYIVIGIFIAVEILERREKWSGFSSLVGGIIWPIISLLLVCRYLKSDFTRDFKKSFRGERE